MNVQEETMFVGAYWSQRAETKESAAGRVNAFLRAVPDCGIPFARWYSKAKSRAAALRAPIKIDVVSIAAKLKANRGDFDRKPIRELGFSFSAWNGAQASCFATIGGWSEHVGNTAILDLGEDCTVTMDVYRALVTEMVRAFDPDHAVVASDGQMRRAGATKPWEAGVFTYTRGGAVEPQSPASAK
jgi:hypothetical protein